MLAHPLEAPRLPGGADATLDHGDVVESGGLRIEAMHTPGHTDGMLAFVVNGSECFTGDTLFAGSVGGVRGATATSFEDLRSSIMDGLLKLDPACVLNPGHIGHTTVAREWETNPFVRLWRGLDGEGSEPCTALGEPATLILWGDDYDGGYKAWVRWPRRARRHRPGQPGRAGLSVARGRDAARGRRGGARAHRGGQPGRQRALPGRRRGGARAGARARGAARAR